MLEFPVFRPLCEDGFWNSELQYIVKVIRVVLVIEPFTLNLLFVLMCCVRHTIHNNKAKCLLTIIYVGLILLFTSKNQRAHTTEWGLLYVLFGIRAWTFLVLP